MLPLLRTKISIPPVRQQRVDLARLIERIGEGMKRALTLIVAPAGLGKTTLIAEWARVFKKNTLALRRSWRKW